MLPEYITHYFSGKDYMLKNLCNLPFEEAATVIADLKETGKRVWVHSGYLRDRHRVEAWLYHEFVNKGKKPHLHHPLYFVLGENNDFFKQNGFFSDKDPEKLQLPLALFSSDMISFTYPDSMTSLNIVSPPPVDTYDFNYLFQVAFEAILQYYLLVKIYVFLKYTFAYLLQNIIYHKAAAVLPAA